MGRAISRAREKRVRQLLADGQLSIRAIAKAAGCARGTVDRIKAGKKVSRKRAEAPPQFKRCRQPYPCGPCSDIADREVLVTFSPCVACAARAAIAARKTERINAANAKAQSAPGVANTDETLMTGALQSPHALV